MGVKTIFNEVVIMFQEIRDEEIKRRLLNHLEKARGKNPLYYCALAQAHLDDTKLTDLHLLCAAKLPEELDEQQLICLIEALPDFNTDLNTKSSKGYIPLHFAIANNFVQVVEYLFFQASEKSREPMVNSEAEYGRTPMSIAAFNSHYQIMQLLLMYGADPNAYDTHYGFTPLHNAITLNRYEAVQLLLAWSLTDRYLPTKLLPESKPEKSETPYQLMIKQKDVRLLKIFLKNKIFPQKDAVLCDPQGNNRTIRTILHDVQDWNPEQIQEIRILLRQLLFEALKHDLLKLLEKDDSPQHQLRVRYQTLHNTIEAQYTQLSLDRLYPQQDHYLPQLNATYIPNKQLSDWLDQQTRMQLQENDLPPSQNSTPVQNTRILPQVRMPFEASAPLKNFYVRILLKLNEFFLAEKLLSTGKFSPRTLKHFTGSAVGCLGMIVPLPFLTSSGQAAGNFLSWCIDNSIVKHAEKISRHYPGIMQIEEMVQRLALKLTRIYQEPLEKLTKQGATFLADAAVCLMLQTLAKKSEGLSNIAPELFLIRAVIRPPADGASLLRLLEQYKVLTQSGKLWRASGIFCKSGIKTLDGVRYLGGGTKPHKYGYRLGTREEALQYGMQVCGTANTDRVDKEEKQSTGHPIARLPWLSADIKKMPSSGDLIVNLSVKKK